jgi:hypothetical protein
MSSTCNVIMPNAKKSSSLAILAEKTELEVELGSASFAEGFKSLLSAIAATEYREFSLIEGHMASALDAIQATLKHYATVLEIDPDRGMTKEEKDALASLELKDVSERWIAQNLYPDFQKTLHDITQATATGNPAEMLLVFTERVERVERLLKDAQGNHEKPKVIHLIWSISTALVDALMAGQLVAVVNSEAHGRLQAS